MACNIAAVSVLTIFGVDGATVVADFSIFGNVTFHTSKFVYFVVVSNDRNEAPLLLLVFCWPNNRTA